MRLFIGDQILVGQVELWMEDKSTLKETNLEYSLEGLMLKLKLQYFGHLMQANLENSAVATGLEKVSFHSNPKERQCQRMFKLLHNCTRLTG